MSYNRVINIPEYIPFYTIRKKNTVVWGTMGVGINMNIWLPRYHQDHHNLVTLIRFVVGPMIWEKYFPIPEFYSFDTLYFLYKRQQEIDKIVDKDGNPGGVDTLIKYSKSYMVAEIKTPVIQPGELSRGAGILMDTISKSSPTSLGEFV